MKSPASNFISRRIFLQHSTSIIGLTTLSLVACGAVQPAEKTMKLETTAFAANNLIPAKYTCDGANISPPLSWDAPPEGTQSFALIVDDPDAPVGIFVHWVLYNIPAQVRQLSENVTAQTLPQGSVQGKNDFGNIGYGGPCPPSGTHRYFFKLYALNQQLNLQPGVTKKQLLAAMNDCIVATTELVGRYSRRS